MCDVFWGFVLVFCWIVRVLLVLVMGWVAMLSVVGACLGWVLMGILFYFV